MCRRVLATIMTAISAGIECLLWMCGSQCRTEFVNDLAAEMIQDIMDDFMLSMLWQCGYLVIYMIEMVAADKDVGKIAVRP